MELLTMLTSLIVRVRKTGIAKGQENENCF
jgi:hypothetical protein